MFNKGAYRTIRGLKIIMSTINFESAVKLTSFAESAELVKNPHTGKLFISFSNGESAAISEKLAAEDPSNWKVSRLMVAKTSEGGLVCYEPGNSNVVRSLF